MKRSVKILSALAAVGLIAGVSSAAFADNHEHGDHDTAKAEANEKCEHKDEKGGCKGDHKDGDKGHDGHDDHGHDGHGHDGHDGHGKH